jgi:transcriptional regulator with XRE-family HTH domain
MAIKDVRTHIKNLGLVEASDPEIAKPIFRRPGFERITTFDEMEKILSAILRKKREEKHLNREQLAMLLGLSGSVFARYERAVSKLHVTRLVHLAEVLGTSPVEMIYAAAPHLFGQTPQEAHAKMELINRILLLPERTTSVLFKLVEELAPPRPG